MGVSNVTRRFKLVEVTAELPIKLRHPRNLFSEYIIIYSYTTFPHLILTLPLIPLLSPPVSLFGLFLTYSFHGPWALFPFDSPLDRPHFSPLCDG